MHAVLVLALALATATIYLAAFHVDPLQSADAHVLAALTRIEDTPLDRLTELILDLMHPLVYALACAGLLVWGWRRRGRGSALVAAALLIGANLTAQLLKPALAEPRLHEVLERQIDAVSWPSGHATAAAALGLAVLLLAPRAAPVALAFALAVGISVMVHGWHFPSDVLGGYAVAGTWAAAAVRLRRPAATAAPRRRSRPATG